MEGYIIRGYKVNTISSNDQSDLMSIWLQVLRARDTNLDMLAHVLSIAAVHWEE